MNEKIEKLGKIRQLPWRRCWFTLIVAQKEKIRVNPRRRQGSWQIFPILFTIFSQRTTRSHVITGDIF
jgi:hypothetical protein